MAITGVGHVQTPCIEGFLQLNLIFPNLITIGQGRNAASV